MPPNRQRKPRKAPPERASHLSETRFKKGASGNPQGRPVTYKTYLRKLIGEHGEKAFDIIWEIARGKRLVKQWIPTRFGPELVNAPPPHKVQLDAATTLAEHLVGKPVASVELGNKDGKPFEVSDARARLADKLAALHAAKAAGGGGGKPQ